MISRTGLAAGPAMARNGPTLIFGEKEMLARAAIAIMAASLAMSQTDESGSNTAMDIAISFALASNELDIQSRRTSDRDKSS